MKNQSKIRRLSSRLHFLFLLLLILAPAVTAGFWLFYESIPRQLICASFPFLDTVPETLDGVQRFLGFLVSFLPLAVKLFAILTIMRLLKLYRDGSIFSAAHVALFKRLGHALIYYGIAGILQNTGLGLVMTMNNPPGQRILSIGMGSNDMTLFVIAAIVLMLSWVMDEGRQQAEDQALTI